MIRETIDWLKSVYAVPSAEAIALRELEESKRKLLEAQTAREYGECNQGRDCPVRVAKIGQRYPKYPQPMFVPYINRQLKALAKWMLLALLGWLVWVPILYLLLRA